MDWMLNVHIYKILLQWFLVNTLSQWLEVNVTICGRIMLPMSNCLGLNWTLDNDIRMRHGGCDVFWHLFIIATDWASVSRSWEHAGPGQWSEYSAYWINIGCCCPVAPLAAHCPASELVTPGWHHTRPHPGPGPTLGPLTICLCSEESQLECVNIKPGVRSKKWLFIEFATLILLQNQILN